MLRLNYNTICLLHLISVRFILNNLELDCAHFKYLKEEKKHNETNKIIILLMWFDCNLELILVQLINFKF